MGDHVIALREGETAVVGYGSLLSAASVSRTLQREYDGPFVFAEIADWRRSWDVSMPNAAFYYNDGDERIYPERILYLNARHRRGERMNCAIFVARDDELLAMHGREWIYTPTVITDALRGARVEGGDALMYVGRPEHLPQGPHVRRPHQGRSLRPLRRERQLALGARAVYRWLDLPVYRTRYRRQSACVFQEPDVLAGRSLVAVPSRSHSRWFVENPSLQVKRSPLV